MFHWCNSFTLQRIPTAGKGIARPQIFRKLQRSDLRIHRPPPPQIDMNLTSRVRGSERERWRDCAYGSAVAAKIIIWRHGE
ncbi:hypothetical protein OPV22_005936 [Ensete ventricosum]|uniref:Uncharacterized protein n=1 Tax=Ensete ventricosum TaxID=4639 RepID=A0AAV8RSG5_ENSVE|nr:hypothetical protein OPV22_005936 [Ensete ventricosum]